MPPRGIPPLLGLPRWVSSMSGITLRVLDGSDRGRVFTDLRAPITYKWTSTGATFSSQTANTYGQWTIGTSPTTYRTVTVKATDADGVTATATRTVTFKRVAGGFND